MGTGKDQLVEKHPGFLLAFFLEQILHIGRQPPDYFHSKVQTVFLHIPVSGHIVKCLEVVIWEANLPERSTPSAAISSISR